MNNEELNIDVQKLKPFTRFIYTIGVLPTSYLLSMTYEEQLIWLCNYLKETVIPTVNNNGLAVEELQAKYIELKSYVDNYFDNLDVQEEINNKLDEMVEDGTLQEIIADYLNSKAIFGFDTIQDLKESTNLINGSYAQTLGYNAKNDGGEGLYKIRTITNDDIIDNATIIALENNNTLIAELINNEVNFMQFGCYGDGIHDDTNNIKKAITYAGNNNKTIISSQKDYLITDYIVFPDVNLKLNQATFKTNYSIKITANNKHLDFPRVTNNGTLSENVGIELFECYTNKIYIPFIENHEIGLLLSADTKGCVYNNITIQEIRNCLTSLKLDNGTNGWINENTFIGGRLWHTSEYITLYGSNIIKIHSKGSSVHTNNNNYFLHQCIEGNEGEVNGLKIKLEYSNYNIFEDLRYEGITPKIDCTNSLRNILNNGYELGDVIFVNDEITRFLNGNTNIISKSGNPYFDITLGTNSYASILTRKSNGNPANKITGEGIITYDSSANEVMRFKDNDIDGYYNNEWKRFIRLYGKNLLFSNCDFTNGCVVINAGNNTNNGAFLWVSNGHLYGKIGTPSNNTDGTVIL